MHDPIVKSYLNSLNEAVDKTTVRELVLYITNDSQLYRQRTQPIIKNLSNKVGKATYDGVKAIKAFMNLVNDGIKKYEKEHAGKGFAKGLDKKTKESIAQELLDYYTEQIGESKEAPTEKSSTLSLGEYLKKKKKNRRY